MSIVGFNPERSASVLNKYSACLILCLLVSGFCKTNANEVGEESSPVHRLGFSLGTPAGLNIVSMVNLPITTISTSGMNWGESLVGLQVGASVFRSQQKSFFRALNLLFGMSDYEDGKEWNYWGIDGMFSWKLFLFNQELHLEMVVTHLPR
jgi:hypothetical protein